MEARRAVVVVVVGFVCLSPLVAAGETGRTAANTAPTEAAQTAPPDPEGDPLGWEDGYWYDESIPVDGSDGLSGPERDAFLARSMARVEHIRRLEFTQQVRVEFVRPEELYVPRNDTYGLSTNEQLWEALFLYGEDTNASRTVRRAHLGNVLGFAAEEGSDHIVVVDSTPARPTVAGATLIHELVHMLQDQRFDLGRARYRRHTLDGEFAKDGLVEGEAASVTDRYRENCKSEWQCVEMPTEGGGGGRSAPARFYRLTYFPYAAGEAYARALVERNGWSAVTAAHEQPPVSTETVIHPARTDPPVPVSLDETAHNGWTRTDERPETVGEAGIYTLFWRRSAENSPIDEANLSGSGGGYGYVSRPSSGWGNDRLYTYANGDERGYVWKTVWDSQHDAREFRDAYAAILKNEGATRRGPHAWRIDGGAFGDAFSLRRTGPVVTVVNGPTIPALDDIHPLPTDEQPNATARTDTRATNATTTATTGPGFGGPVALLAVVLAGLALSDRV